MTEFDKFLLWEATSRDTIDFKKVYVDIANDLIAGLLLSQVIYWYLPDKYGETKLRVEKDGHLWIAKGRDDWHTEIRISAKQFDRASGILVRKGILIKDYFMFGGFRTVHIRVDYARFMELWQIQLESGHTQQRVRPVLPKGEDRSRLKGTTGLTQKVRPITKSTTETTNKDISLEKKSSESEPSADAKNGETAKGIQENVLVDTRTTYEVDEETHFWGGPHPQVLAKYASEVVRGAAETLDKEIMGEDAPEMGALDDVFGENPRQDEIDAHKKAPRMTKDELLLASMGAGVPGEIRSVLASMRDRGWQVRDERVETVLAQFFEITGFEIPSNKAQRKLFEVGARDHLDETLFEGRIPELYKVVWASVVEDVSAGDLVLTHPRAFSKLMYGAVNREAGRDTSKGPAGGLTRNQVLHVFQNKGLVEVKEIEGAGKHGFFWTDTGEPVGKKLPRDLIEKHILNKSSV